MSIIAINTNTGQTVRLVSQVLDGYSGARVDGYTPIVTSVFFPDLTAAAGYPMAMTRVDTGLFVHGLVIPTGATALGTFVASVFYIQPNTGQEVWDTFLIQVGRPFGNASITPL